MYNQYLTMVGVVHQHGIDAVFSVLTSIGMLDEAFRGAYDNICRKSSQYRRDTGDWNAQRGVMLARKPLYCAPKLTRQSPLRRRPLRGRRAEGRKVRLQGRVPGNAWGETHDQCNREQTADGSKRDQVRVKGCGKSAPRGW